MRITTHIRNLIFLWRENKKEKAVDLKIDVSELIFRVKHNYTKKNSWVRNRVCLLIRKWRKQKPYQVIDYSKAKELYENQPEPIDFSKVSTGSYVVKYTEEYAVKGKRWCEYFINFNGKERGIFKVNSEYPDFFSLVDYKDSVVFALHERDAVMFRFATKEEIEQFKIARKNYKQKKKEIEALQKQINKLYKQL